MRIPPKLTTTGKVTGEQLKTTVNQLIDVARSSQLSSDGRTTRLKKTPMGTTVEAMIKSTVATTTSTTASSSSYDGGFTIVDISTYDSETGVFDGEIIVTYGLSYIAPQPDADPPVSESYNAQAGYMSVNAIYQPIDSEKFDITASKSVVIYSEISDTTPFIGTITLALINDISEDLPTNSVFVWLGDVKFTAQIGTFGQEGFVRASITVNQVWQNGSQVYLPAFKDANLT